MAKTKTALITGGAQRVGRALALSLAAAGWDVAVHYRTSRKPAEELARQIRSMGRKAWLVRADLSNAKNVSAIFPLLAQQNIMPDCLINNAAMFEKDTLAMLEAKRFHAHLDTNLLAPLLLTRDFAARYKGTEGNVINITDGLKGWSMSPTFLSYMISKQALADATRSLARELAPNIRINAIAPGATLEGKQDKSDTFAKLKKIIPLKRTSSTDEICEAMHYILSAPSLTGQILSLCGGMDLPQ
jgi:NAD(P)-dependent dehydrogenase (short-subunit alcohol dehydrogenase family)